MLLVLFAFGMSVLVEFGLLLPIVWREPIERRVTAAIALSLGLFAVGAMLAWRPSVGAGLLFAVAGYRAVNMIRVADGRTPAARLRRTSGMTSLWLIGGQLVVGTLWFGGARLHVAARTWLDVLLILQLLAAMLLLTSTVRRLGRTRPAKVTTHFSDKELPAITIAIPARNEDEQLEECLRSVIASDYPKFEVLVLDDCSQDRTAEVIRSFAHDGVRFIPGEEPKPNWLAKNQAYERLASEASGDLILFAGVDVRFASQSIRELVATMRSRSKTMLSIIPINEARGLSLVQSMRYFWELSPPRRLFNRPAVLSSCWLITCEQLQKSGGFAAVARSITPEAYFAREAIPADGYRFMRSNTKLGVTSVKTRVEQRDTATRTRYPQLHRRPEMVCLVSLIELTCLVAPFGTALAGLSGMFGWAAEIVATTSSLLLLAAFRGSLLAFPRVSLLRAFAFPIAVLIDIGLLQFSMWQYEFSEVTWKGRNVCIPVMHTVPHLPKLQ